MMIHARQQSGARPTRRGHLYLRTAAYALLLFVGAGSGAERARVTAAPIETPLSDTAGIPGETSERESVAGGGGATLVYSNTGPTFLYRPGAFRRIADDLRTISTCGCPLNSYEIRVSGGGTGAGSGYSVEVGLYDDCPSFGGQLIPGTAETFVLPDDAEYTLTVNVAPTVVSIPQTIWLGVMFDSNAGGWLVGTQAEIGTTFDFFDFPFFPCEATTGIPGRYGGFWTRIYCDSLGGLAAPTGPSPASGQTDVYPIVQLEWDGGPAPRSESSDDLIDLQKKSDPVLPDSADWVDDVEPGQWCATWERYRAQQMALGNDVGRLACAQSGACDDAALRDAFIPTVDTPTKTIRLRLNVFCLDNGTSCVASAADVEAQMVTLNEDYAPWNIQFEHEVAFINDSTYRNLSWSQEDAMKATYAVAPDEQCNVFVVETPDGWSFGTFPWDSNALTVYGGIVIDSGAFGPGGKILAHEVGHNVGLWHTFHGVFEVNECGACYEFAGEPSDDRGDLCSDTDPTPRNYDCGPPGGSDPCNGVSWGTTHYENYMSYSWCRAEFSPQQAGRFHCWTDQVLSSWEVPILCDVLYDVYFDSFSPPTSLLCEGVQSPTCDPGPLNCGSTYYWQVVASLGINGATATGEIWSFDTPTGPDCNTNGTVDTCDIAFGGIADCNGDGIPDDCQPDSDGDGVPDSCDPCPLDNPDDTDGDGICDSNDICPGGDDTVDFDGDGVPDFCDPCPVDNPDDTDGDGICDSDDICPGGDDTVDFDGDGVPDFCDSCPLDNPDDTDGDGVCDSDDPCPLDNPDDTDGDTICDSDDNCELPNTDQTDCQPNGVGDVCDIAIGGMPDGNGNGVPDACESLFRPMPENGLGVTDCQTDADCTNEAYCIPDAAGGFPGICYIPKNRYLSVAPNAANVTPTARRVSVVLFERSCGGAGNTACTSNAECSGDADGATCDDVAMGSQVIGWFGQPDTEGYVGVVDEASRHYTIWTDLTFPVECGVDEMCPPLSRCDVGLGGSNTCRWDADDTEVLTSVVHLSGCHISPKSRDTRPGAGENRAANHYLIEAIAEGSAIGDSANYSAPLDLKTCAAWGDMTGGTQGNVALPPEGTSGFLDILHQVLLFKDQGTATTPWLDLDPQVPDHTVGFLDMLNAVAGFKDDPYPWDDPCICAGLAPCD